jgi:hypothetical protein
MNGISRLAGDDATIKVGFSSLRASQFSLNSTLFNSAARDATVRVDLSCAMVALLTSRKGRPNVTSYGSRQSELLSDCLTAPFRVIITDPSSIVQFGTSPRCLASSSKLSNIDFTDVFPTSTTDS